MFRDKLEIAGRAVGPGEPVFLVAELSANHAGDKKRALEIIRLAAGAGADAIKLQTYTADSLTIDSQGELFQIRSGTQWDGKTLYELYEGAHTPWDWHEDLIACARDHGLLWFSSPFDRAAVDLLESLDCPAHKIASFELVDHELLRYVAATGKPVIASTGMANLAEIEESLAVLRDAGCEQLALLKCTSAYPAPYEEMNIRTIPDMAKRFGIPVGLSDHTLGPECPLVSVALGASVIEKHFIDSRAVPSADSAFSLKPEEFRAMVEQVRNAEAALGEARYELGPKAKANLVFRRSLFFVRDVSAGGRVSPKDIRAIRPGHGLHPRHLKELIGKTVTVDVKRGTPAAWKYFADS